MTSVITVIDQMTDGAELLRCNLKNVRDSLQIEYGGTLLLLIPITDILSVIDDEAHG